MVHLKPKYIFQYHLGVRRGRDRMVVGFILRLFRQLQYIISNVFLQHVPVSCNNFVKIVYHLKNANIILIINSGCTKLEKVFNFQQSTFKIDEKVPLVRDRDIHNTTIWLTYLNINAARAIRHRHIQRF